MRFLREAIGGKSLGEVGEAALRYALSLVPAAEKGSVLLLDPHKEAFEFVAALGWDLSLLKGIRIPKEKILQHRLLGDRPAIITDIHKWNQKLLGPELAQQIAQVGLPKVMLSFPIHDEKGEVIGYLNLDNARDPQAFSQDDLERLVKAKKELDLVLQAALERGALRETERLFRLLFDRLADAVYITALDGTILLANPAAARQTGYSQEELIGKNIMKDLAAEEPAITWDTVNERLLRGEIVVFEEKKRRRDGSIFGTEVAVAYLEYRGRPATISANRDITERKRLEEELCQKIAQLDALNRASALIASQLDLEKLLQNIVSSVRDVTGAEFANVVIFDEEGKPIGSFDPFGAPPLPLRMRPRGFSSWIRTFGKPILIEEIKEDGSTVPPVFWPGETEPIRANPLLLRAGIKSLVGLPIKVGEKVRGIFFVHSLRPKAFLGQETMLHSLASQISVALQNAFLFEALRKSEKNWRELFGASPASLWIEDFSEIKKELDRLKESGVQDLREYLRDHPEFVGHCLKLLRVVEVNHRTLELYKVRDFSELALKLPILIPVDNARPILEEQLLAIWQGGSTFSGESTNRDTKGNTIHIHLSWRVLPGHERDYGRVLVAITDITERVEAEKALQALNSSFTALASTLDFPQLLGLIHQELRKLFPFDAFFVAVLDEKKKELRVAKALEAGEELSIPPIPFDPQASPTAWVAACGTPLFIEDTEKIPPPVPFRQVGRSIRAWAGVPLIAQGEVLGVLSIQSFDPMKFGEREREILLAFASGAATALRNSLLHNRLRSFSEKLASLEEISRKMKLAQSFSELYELVLDAVQNIFGLRYCAILEAGQDALMFVAHRNYPEKLLGLKLPFAEGKGITVAAYLANEPIYVPDVRTDPRYVAGLPTMGCELALPISMAGQKFGVLNVEHDEVDGISPEDQDLLQILASELAVAMAGLQRLKKIETLGRKLAALHEVSQKLQRCTTVDEVCQLAVQAAVERLGYWNVNIGLAQGDFLVPVAGFGEVAQKARPFKKGEGVAGMTWLLGKTHWGKVADFPEAKPVDPRIKLFISVPIGDRGVMQVTAEKEDAFDEDDVTLVEILARHVYEEIRRVELEAELREQAIRDPLTGLYNRRFLNEVLPKELARAERYGHTLSLLIVDIDNFKEINDAYGHVVGDEVLKQVAKTLRENVRQSDYVFRWGGDEFLLLVPETNGEGAESIVQRFSHPCGLLSAPPTVCLSLGYASFNPRKQPMPSAEDLFREADRLLYEIKAKKKTGQL